MSTRRAVALVSSLALAAAGALAVVPAATASATASGTHPSQEAVCPAVPAHFARCLVHVLHTTPQRHGGPSSGTTPSGFSPSAIAQAYGFSTTGGTGETIAVVDAYGSPTITTDFQAFSRQYHLTCTTCFTIVNQKGTSALPRANRTWELEQSLDVEWAHAMAPKATVLLVEATSNSFTNLMTAVDYAATQANYVSMSWGGRESSTETTYNGTFTTQSGVSYFAASGDSAAAVIYPSASPNVVSVGGTTLTVNKTTGAWTSESAWSTAGGGCSSVEKATTAQLNYLTAEGRKTLCTGKRATPDISLDANPYTGVAVYTSNYGWVQVGGTSASTVMVAAHAAETKSALGATQIYNGSLKVYDVTTGSNGHTCEPGYDLCTGVGSWNTSAGSSGTSSPPPATTGSLSFTPATTTVTAGTPVTLTLTATPTASSSTHVQVTLSSTSSTGKFSTTKTGTFTSSLTVTVSDSSPTTIYYEDTVAGTQTITATATGWSTATAKVTVTPGTLAAITVSPSSATVAEGGTQTFTATGYDTYGNVVTSSNVHPTWSTAAALGSVTPPNGTSTTFTAGTTAGTGTVTAAQTGFTATAKVTVTTAVAPALLTVKVGAGTSVKHGRWEHTPITVTVKATGISPVAGATVALLVYSGSSCAGAPVASGTGTTGTTGAATFTLRSATGTYCADAAVSSVTGGLGVGTTTFTVPVTAAVVSGLTTY